MRALVWPLWLARPATRGREAIREAVAALEQSRAGTAACQCVWRARLPGPDGRRREGTAVWGTRALRLAEEVGDVHATLRALTWMGAMQCMRGDASGRGDPRTLPREGTPGWVHRARWRRCTVSRAQRGAVPLVSRCRRYVDAGSTLRALRPRGIWAVPVALRGQHDLERGTGQRRPSPRRSSSPAMASGTARSLALVTVGRAARAARRSGAVGRPRSRA